MAPGCPPARLCHRCTMNILVVLVISSLVQGWPDGAPCLYAAFESMNPLEAIEHQGGLVMTIPPYTIVVENECYFRSQPIALTLRGNTSTDQFRGFVIQPISYKGPREGRRIGQFLRLDDNGSWQQQCFRFRDSATHSHDEKKSQIKLWWRVEDEQDYVQFVATVVESLRHFWVRSVVSVPIPPCSIEKRMTGFVAPPPTMPLPVKSFKLQTQFEFNNGNEFANDFRQQTPRSIDAAADRFGETPFIPPPTPQASPPPVFVPPPPPPPVFVPPPPPPPVFVPPPPPPPVFVPPPQPTTSRPQSVFVPQQPPPPPVFVPPPPPTTSRPQRVFVPQQPPTPRPPVFVQPPPPTPPPTPMPRPQQPPPPFRQPNRPQRPSRPEQRLTHVIPIPQLLPVSRTSEPFASPARSTQRPAQPRPAFRRPPFNNNNRNNQDSRQGCVDVESAVTCRAWIRHCGTNNNYLNQFCRRTCRMC